MRNISSLCCWW